MVLDRGTRVCNVIVERAAFPGAERRAHHPMQCGNFPMSSNPKTK